MNHSNIKTSCTIIYAQTRHVRKMNIITNLLNIFAQILRNTYGKEGLNQDMG